MVSYQENASDLHDSTENQKLTKRMRCGNSVVVRTALTFMTEKIPLFDETFSDRLVRFVSGCVTKEWSSGRELLKWNRRL